MVVEIKPKQYELFITVPLKAGIDKLKQIQEKGAIVFGASGHMGTNIVDALTRANVFTIRNDISYEFLEKALQKTIKTQEKAASLRKLALPQLEKAKQKLGPAVVFPENNKIPSLDRASDKYLEAKQFVENGISDPLLREKFKNTMLFVEAGPENLSFKQNVFGFFAYALDKDAILATNTSTLRVDDIAARVPNPERVIGLHFFDPADRNPLLEIIASPKTSPETILAIRELAIAMGKTPIICFCDTQGAIANRILVGVLNEAAHISYEGVDLNLVDKVFLKIFYSEQIKIQLPSAKKQLAGAPKLGFFKDETHLYKKITKAKSNLKEKQKLLEEAIDKLNQKVVYAGIVQNLSCLGSFFVPPPIVQTIKDNALNQLKVLKNALLNLESEFKIKPYEFPKSSSTKAFSKEEVRDRLIGAYIAISQQILLEGLASPQDVELACKQGFYWNTGPLEMAQRLGTHEVQRLTNLVHKRLNNLENTGISKPGTVIEFKNNELSGIQTYIQDGIGHIVLGRRHIQNLTQQHNSLSPEMLKAIEKSMINFEKNPNVKSIFFKSQGGGPFSAGADLNYVNNVINWDKEKTSEYLKFGHSIIMNTIKNCKKTTVAILDGLALGGGAELACACDYRIGTYYAGVSFPEVNLVHIYPGWGGDKTFPAIVGKKLAEAIMVPPLKKGLVILSAEDAHEVGFLDKLVLQSELPHLIANLIDRKTPEIDIYKKLPKKNNYDKNNYSERMIKRYNLDKLDHPRRRILSAFSSNLTRNLIKYSHNMDYKPSEDELRKVLMAGRFNANVFIGFKLWLAKSYFAKFIK